MGEFAQVLRQSLPAWVLWLLSVVGVVIHGSVYYGKLPARLACHFDGQGKVNGYCSRSEILGSYLGVTIGVSALMAILAATIPMCKNFSMSQLSVSLSQEAKSRISLITCIYMLLLSFLINVFMLVIYQQTFATAIQCFETLETKCDLGSLFIVALVLFLVLVFASIIGMLLFIRRVLKDAAQSDPAAEATLSRYNACMCYRDPANPDLCVPKLVGYGWTINMGHPMAYPLVFFFVGAFLLAVMLPLMLL